MPDSVVPLVNESGLSNLIEQLADQIMVDRQPGVSLRLVGIRSRGVPLAHRLAAILMRRLEQDVPVGAVDITLYRDDLEHRGSWPVLRGTDISFDVEGQEVVLVDDVISTGRTARAALNAVCDLGRPVVVRLAVLIDRGGRELPIQPDYLCRSLDVDPDRKVLLRIRPIDDNEGIVTVLT